MSYVHLNSDNPFPYVNDRGVFAGQIGEKEEIRFMNQDNGTIVCSYVVSMESTFDNPYARECRGITFDSRGSVISRPLHKFFNVNEKETTQVHAIDWTQVVRVMDKRDGSMIHTVDVRNVDHNSGEIFDVKSKKSYSSDVANSARKYIKARQDYVDFCRQIVGLGLTAIFEWTSPEARIVLPYREDELKLLHVRDNATGEYFSRAQLNVAAGDYHIPLVDDVNLDGVNKIYTTRGEPIEYALTIQRPLIDQLLALTEVLEDTEGWVIQFKNGDMVKLKCKAYIAKHRTMTGLRVRDVAQMVVDEIIDDQKALLVSEGLDITEILKIEKDVVEQIDLIIKDVEDSYEHSAKFMSKKEAALAYGPAGSKCYYFGLLMKKMDGNEPDYKGYFEKHILSDRYDLRQLNFLDSVAEADDGNFDH